jgi:D-xylose transport system substrate-binding protein
MSLRTSLVFLSLLLSVLIGWTIAKSGPASISSPSLSQDGGDEQILIGLSLGTLQEERWQRDRDRFVARAEELGAKVLVQSGNNDGLRQMQDVEALISRGVDVLVIVAFNPAAMAKAVETAHAAGVPVICYDRIITDADVDLYISFDNVRVGRLQAEYLIEKLGGQGRIVRVYGPKTDRTGLLFKEGQDAALAPYLESGAIEVIHEDYAAGWSPDNAKKIVGAAITRNGDDFQAVLATNDGTAGGAIQALREEGLAGKVLVTGQDADLAACRRIVAGEQTMSVYKPLAKLASLAAETAYALAGREVVVARQSTPNGMKEVPSLLEEVVVVDASNLQETVVRDGFHKAEDLGLESR